MCKAERYEFMAKTLLLNQTLLRDVMILLLCDRITFIVTMIVRFDDRNSVMLKMVLREFDNNLVMVRMIVRFNEETDSGRNDCTVGQRG
jgi:hypothetical protein